MSVEIQKQIKDNSTSVQEFFQDLYKWTAEQGKEEKRRETRKRVSQGLPVQAAAPKENGSSTGKAAGAPPAKALPPAADAEEEPEESIKRDKLPMPQYYNSWDRYDVDAQLDKLDDEALSQQQAEREEREAAKDQILDELALRPDGDRKRTSAARPRVKISVRRSGRRAAPVDLALPRKEEANRYFAEGRFREAVATYTAGLDLLEKYEPPDAASGAASQEDVADGTGQETEALALKTTLLANRALALLKLEEWKEVIVDCTEALRFDPQHHKATLRRGFAFARMKRWPAAARDLERAVKGDPSDSKASAELQMARRMLAEQVKEARAHAKNAMRDPTREPKMPTRTLQVQLAQASRQAPAPEPGPTVVAAGTPAAASSAAAGGPAGATPAAASRKPYVPRAVRMRGRQAVMGQAEPGPGAVANGTEASGAPATSFYAFEGQWARLRGKPRERAALLRRVGARCLPALFRESLDSELVASVADALAAELRADDGAASFAAEAMGALSRTPRFDLSLRGLSEDERRVCGDVLATCAEAGQSGEDIAALQRAYAPPPPPAPREPEEGEEEAAGVGRRPPAAEGASGAAEEAVGQQSVARDAGEPEAPAPAPAPASAPAPSEQPPESGGFSLDDCD